MNLKHHPSLVCGILVVIVVGLSLLLGSESISLSELLSNDTMSSRIVFELRLPRVILAFLVGGGLALVGLCYQILFQNPLAEPYLLGVSSASLLGIAVAEIFLGLSAVSSVTILFGVGGALIISSLFVVICFIRWGSSLERVALFGLGVNFVLSSVILLLLSYHQQSTGGASLKYLFGQIPWVSHQEVIPFATFTLALLIGIWAFGRRLDALSLGDSVARTLGVNVLSTRILLILITSLFLAVVTAFTGSIGFVGLVAPHVVRIWTKPKNIRSGLQRCFFLGGTFVLFSDLISRILYPPLEFPIGVFTTILGGPLFLILLWRQK